MVSLSTDPAQGWDADSELWWWLEACWRSPSRGVRAGRLANTAGGRAHSSREGFRWDVGGSLH